MRRFFSKKSSNPRTQLKPAGKPAVKQSLPKQSLQSQPTSTTNANSYETVAAASYGNSEGSASPFVGILNDRSRPLQHYERSEIENTPRSAPCHPLDDSLATTHGFSADPGLLTVTGVEMTLPYTVIVSESTENVEPVRKVVDNVFEIIHSSVNGWSATSEVSKLNNSTSRKPLKISATLERVFQVVDELYDSTDSRFDPTSGILKLAFLEAYSTKGGPPEPNKHYKRAMGWKKCIVRSKMSATRQNANTLIDLDGISKGFCIDLIVEALLSAGYMNIYVDWAGDIRSAGQHPSGRPWRTALMMPPALPRVFKHWKDESLGKMLDGSDIGYLINFDRTKEVALASSGDYFQIKKYGYHHIMRVDDMCAMKASARSVGAASVLASTCAVADGLATAAMTFDTPKEAAAFLRNQMERMPDKVFGFCVIGRGPEANDASLRTAQFMPTESSKSKQVNALSSQEEESLPVLLAEDLLRMRESIVNVPGRLTWSGGFVNVDSLTSCTMEPEPRVSFVLPLEHEKSLHILRDDLPKQLKLELLGGDGTKPVYNGLQILLEVTNTFFLRGDRAILVIARIVEIRHGGGNSMVAMLGGSMRQIVQHDSFVLGDFRTFELEEQAKKLFSELPSSVAVIAATASDGAMYGLTATSVKISEHAAHLVSFNLMHTSTFFKAFGGKGSPVTVHILSKGHEGLSKTFTSNALISAETEKALVAGSHCMFKGVVGYVETVEDHAIVIAKMERGMIPLADSDSLIWHRRRMTTL